MIQYFLISKNWEIKSLRTNFVSKLQCYLENSCSSSHLWITAWAQLKQKNEKQLIKDLNLKNPTNLISI